MVIHSRPCKTCLKLGSAARILAVAFFTCASAYGQYLPTSGQQEPFTFPAVSGPTLVTGLVVMVLPGASKLTIQLADADPANVVNFQLFLRYGTPIGLSGGNSGSAIADYSTLPGTNLSLTIQTPDLKVGSYFIGVGILTFGVPVSGTIAATVAYAPCITVTPLADTVPVTGGSGTLTVSTAISGCTWTATSDSAWLTVSPGSGNGSGSITYTAASNTSSAARTGTITVSGQGGQVTFKLTQATACTYSISPSEVSLPSSSGTGNVTITTAGGCPWTATSDSPWLTLSPAAGTGGGIVAYTAAANVVSSSRTAIITIASQTVSITQAANCSYNVSPLTVTVPASGGGGKLTVATMDGCSWAAMNDSPWLSLLPNAGSGSATVLYSAAANTGSGSRTAKVSIGGQTVTFSQPDNTPKVTAAGVTNSASFLPGLTPGSMLTIFGTGLSNAVGIVQSSSFPLPTQLLGTSVAINGFSAPLFAIANVNGAEQINLQVPYEVTLSQLTANVVVNNNGSVSAPAPLVILAAQPGIFTVDGSAGVIAHSNGQLVTRSNPAAQGEVVIIYATGLGAVNPTPRTGQPADASAISFTASTPTATLGGIDSEVLFSGLAPGFAGLYQVNVRVPETIAGGDKIPVLLKIASATSQAGVTFAVAQAAN